ncbi:MAG: flagellar protein FliS [bacterium]|nr:flagellar protein FliS [bacterium]
MTNEQIQQYTLRITQASKTQIIVILYDIILDDVESARSAYHENDYETFKNQCNHIKRCVSDLIEALNFDYEISLNLRQLYLYINREASAAVIRKDPARLEMIQKIAENLKEAFLKISEQDSSGPIMENTQTVYAGLTYGKGNLTENLQDQGTSRGFRV